MAKEKHYDIIVAPMFTEKATIANELSKYTFKVASDATKPQIKEAVEKVFDTEVKTVNVLNRQGKAKVFKGRKGVRVGYKRAIVTLAKGKTIELTAGAK